MSIVQLPDYAQVISVLRAQIDVIETKELPMTRSKIEVCRAAGWGWLESYFYSQANHLEHELETMKQLIDRQIDVAAAR